MPVFDEYTPSPIALVKDVLIDPETGKVLAFIIQNNKIVVPLDIERFTTNGIYVADKDRFLSLDDVLRVQEVSKMRIGIVGANVVAQKTKIILGKAVDYEVDTTHFALLNIHSAKTFCFFRFQERIISAKYIVRIEKDRIVVKDGGEVSEREKAPARSGALAA